MTRWTHLHGATAMVFVLSASAASADVTGQEVWNDWRAYFSSFGYEVTATEATSGDTLTVTDLNLSMELPEEEGSFSWVMDTLEFTDRSDGSVSVQMPSESTIEFDVDPEEGEAAEGVVSLVFEGLNMVVSGDPGDMLYSYTAAGSQISLVELTVEGQKMDEIKFNAILGNMIGQSSMQLSDMRRASQKVSVDSVEFEIRAVIPEEDGSFVMTGQTDSLDFTGTVEIPLEFDAESPEDMFKEGFAMDGTFRRGPTTFAMTAVDDGAPFSVAMDVASTELDMSMNKDSMGFTGTAGATNVDLSGEDIPFPISVSLTESRFAMLMPLAASPEDQDFGFGFTLGGLTVPDMLWDIFDPGAILTRAPATLNLDLSGKTRVFADLMDPSIQDSDDFPGELKALTLNDLTLEVAGAELVGSGDFTFDNSDKESFDGMPRPEGALDLRLLGGNKLLDSLIQMGIVPEAEAMGARMMMGVFAVPGPSEDELLSRIEVNEEGHVLANGQRIK